MRNRVSQGVLVVLLIISPTLIAATWSLSVNEKEGLPVLKNGGSTALTATYAFWAATGNGLTSATNSR